MASEKHFSRYQYFDRSEFSPRYNDNIFTVAFENMPERVRSLDGGNGSLDWLSRLSGITLGGGFCIPHDYVVYPITVCRGKYTWTVKKRFTEFVALRTVMTHGVHGGKDVHDIVKDLDLPPTTIFDMSHDKEFLMDRQEGLAEFLVVLLQKISAKHLVTEDILKFIGIDDEDPQAPCNSAKVEIIVGGA